MVLAQTNDNYDPDSLINKGRSLSDLGRYQEAIKLYDKALAINPNDVNALKDKGVALHKLGKYKEPYDLLAV